MYPEDISEPVPVAGPEFFATERSETARVAVAIYLLMAGPLFVDGADRDEDMPVLPPDEDLAAMNVHADRVRRLQPRAAPPDLLAFAAPPSVGQIAGLVADANESGRAEIAARAVALGTRSEDDLIRVCALGSAVEFFDPSDLDLPGQVAWVLRNAGQAQTHELMATLLSRLGRPRASAGIAPPPGPPAALAGQGLMAVHGTVLPGSRPGWSVPGSGPLFAHLKSIRPDIYDSGDHFRWEGGYSDYAREVAGESLHSWQAARGLGGIDLVAHSHGCSVVMEATRLGASFGRMVFLSCPVHWPKYSLPTIDPGVVSIRVHADATILMDRGGQRFPPGTIPDVVLPLWYTSHGATNQPATWQSQNLDRFLL